MYSVRSGYKLTSNLYGAHDSASNNEQRMWWTTLWKIRVPQKVKMFIWRAYHACIPTNFSLWKRKVDLSPMCTICKTKFETVDHALCGCKRSKQICDTMFQRVDLKIPVQDNFADRIIWLAKHLNGEEFERACLTFWSLWNDRNSFNHNMDVMEWTKLCEWIHSYWEKTRDVTNSCSETTIPMVNWRMEVQRVQGLRLYTDATVGSHVAGSGYGAFIIDAAGNKRGTMEFFDQASHTPLAAEIQAIIHSMRLLQRLNITTACVCSDSVNAIKMIQDVIPITSDVHHWILQIQNMGGNFENLSFIYVSRNCNRKANYFARHALAKQRSMLWLDNFPYELHYSTHCKCTIPCIDLK